jgi:hypothetical protein
MEYGYLLFVTMNLAASNKAKLKGNYLNAKSIEVLKRIFYCDPANNLTIL